MWTWCEHDVNKSFSIWESMNLCCLLWLLHVNQFLRAKEICWHSNTSVDFMSPRQLDSRLKQLQTFNGNVYVTQSACALKGYFIITHKFEKETPRTLVTFPTGLIIVYYDLKNAVHWMYSKLTRSRKLPKHIRSYVKPKEPYMEWIVISKFYPT